MGGGNRRYIGKNKEDRGVKDMDKGDEIGVRDKIMKSIVYSNI